MIVFQNILIYFVTTISGVMGMSHTHLSTAWLYRSDPLHYPRVICNRVKNKEGEVRLRVTLNVVKRCWSPN